MNTLTSSPVIDQARYRSDGFLVLEQFLPASELDKIKKQVGEAYQQTADAIVPSNSPMLVLWRHESQGRRSIFPLDQFSELDGFIRSDFVLDIARRLTDAVQLQLFETIVFSKPPSKGEQFAWHNDASYYPFAPKKFVSFWVALDQCDQENGSMELAIGSHRHGDVDPVDLKTGKSLIGLGQEGMLDPFRENFSVKQPVLNPGDAIAFDGYLWHGSPPNLSNRMRRGVCFRFLTEPTVFTPFNGMGGTFIRQLNLAAGDDVVSPSFPVVWKK